MSTTTSPACVHPVANYHSAFPALQSLPWSHSTLPHSKKRPSIPNSTFSQSLSPPKPPAYLKHTQYAALVREQYQYLLQKRYENTKKLVNDTPQHEQMTNNDILSELDLRLPSFWNAADKSRYLEIDKNGLGVTYIGPGKCEDHAGTVRANFPMRNQCGVYYFEMHVKSKGDDGYIGIGFCSAKNELKRLPGWDKKSFGYHGDDGHSFEGSGIGKKYGPQFKTGDVIGCGVNFASKTAFYTKNGSSLGVAFQDLDVSQPLYPCVGMRTADEYITVNFGQEPFVYDIVQYIQEQKLYLWKDIGTYSLSSNIPMMIKPNVEDEPITEKGKNISQSMDKLVLSYLIHHGYSGTAQALTRDSAYLTGASSTSKHQEQNTLLLVNDGDDGLQQRLDIKTAITQGNIDHALNLLNTHFPAVLQDQDGDNYILFQLKCQKFVEMISDHSDQEYEGRQRTTINHQRRYSEVDSMVSFSSEDDHTSILSCSSQTSSQGYFDDRHDGISEHSINTEMDDVIHHHHHHQRHSYHPLTTINDEKKGCIKWPSLSSMDTNSNNHMQSTSSWIPLNSSRSRSISAYTHYGQSPPITTASPAPGRRTSWAAIVAAPASPTHTDNNTHLMDLADTTHFRTSRRPSLRRSSCSSNGQSACSIMSGIQGLHDVMVEEQDELLGMDGMMTDDGSLDSSIQQMMQTIMMYGQQLQGEYGKDPSAKIKDKLKQIFSLLAYPDPRSSPMGHLMDKVHRETLASDVNVAILVCQNQPDIPPLERVYRQVFTVNKELTYLGHGDSVLLGDSNFSAENIKTML